MRKHVSVLFVGILFASVLAGCSSGQKVSDSTSAKPTVGEATTGAKDCCFKNGTYVGKSGPDERGAIGEITIVVENEKIAKVNFVTMQKDGKIKDEEYGKTNGKIENQEFYNKAQLAVKAAATYGPKLVETQNVSKVDAISGATVSHRQFIEAAGKALAQAK